MKLLISPTSVQEALVVAASGCDIVDIKNIDEGSLGAQPAWIIRQIIRELYADTNEAPQISVAIGDLPNKPGTISLAAYGVGGLYRVLKIRYGLVETVVMEIILER